MKQQHIHTRPFTRLFVPWFVLHVIGTPILLLALIVCGYLGFFCYWAGMGILQGVLIGWASMAHGEPLMRRWIGASLLGGLLCVLIGIIIPSITPNSGSFTGGAISWLTMNIVLGFIQAVFIRTYVPKVWMWIIASVIIGSIQAIGSAAAFIGGLPVGLIVLMLSGSISSYCIDRLLYPYIDKPL